MNSNVLYHGELEKKAAMEQKRTVGDEASADNAPPGIISLLNKRNAQKAGEKRKNVKPTSNGPIKPGTKVTIVRRLKIPECFIPKPASPPRDYRTGKVWRPKLPPKSPGKMSFRVRRSKSDSQLLAKMKKNHRRHSFVGNEHALSTPAPDVSDLVIFSLTHGKARLNRLCCCHCQLSMATILGTSSLFETLFESDPLEYHVTGPFQHLLFTL